MTDSTPLRLVLMPGLHGSAALSDAFVEACAPFAQVSVVSYDPAGPQDVATLADQALEQLPREGQPFAIVAESFSGPIAVHLAAREPRGIVALVLVNSFVVAPAGIARGMAAALTLPLTTRIARPPRRLVRSYLVGEDAPEQLVEQVRTTVGAMSRQALGARLRTLATLNEARSYLTSLLPMFALCGADDRLVGDKALELMIRLRPGLQLHELEGPHLLLQRHPQRCADVIRRCLSERLLA